MKQCDLITNKNALVNHLERHDTDYIVFIRSGYPMAYIDREEIDQFFENDELVSAISRKWKRGTVALSLP